MSGAAFVPLFLLGGFFPVIRRDLDVPSSFLGLMVSAFYLASSMGYVAAGKVVDRLPPHISLRSGAVTIALAVAQLAWPGVSAWAIAAAMFIAGVGHAFVQTAGNAWLARGSRRPAFGFGAKQSSAAAAGMVAGAVVANVPAQRWQMAFLVVGAVLALAALLVGPASPGLTPSAAAPPAPPEFKLVWPAALAALLGAAVALTAAAYFSESMVQQDFRVPTVGRVMFVAASLCVAGRLAIGFGLDLAPERARAACMTAWLVAAAGFSILASSGALPVLTVIGIVLAYGVGWSWTGALLFAVADENPSHPAKVTAAIQAAASIGGMTGPLVGGLVVSRSGFAPLWLVCAVLASVAAGAVMIRTAPRASVSAAA